MDDMQIVELFWQRDQRAIGESEAKYGAYCRAIAHNILADAEDVREAVNDTWWQAWQAIPPQQPQILRAFLGRITRNISFNRCKAQQAHKRGGGQLAAVLEELAECVPGGEDVAAKLELQELTQALNSFVAALPADKRRIFLCRYWYTESVAEIAARFGMTAGAVSTLLHRLRGQLRLYLQEGGYI